MTLRGLNRSLVPRLCLLLIWTLWTYALPEIRVPIVHVPIPYAVLALLAPAVIIGSRREGQRQYWRHAPLVVLGPALLSLGVLIGYLIHRDSAAVDVAWRMAALPWAIPVFVAALGDVDADRPWQGITIGFLVLLAYGAYGFFTGRVGDPAERTIGYFGIHYTASTRNADASYIVVLLFHLVFPATASHGPRAWVAVGLAGLTSAAIVLTQARNAWLAALAGALVFVATAGYLRAWSRTMAVRAVAILAICAVAVALTGSSAVVARRATNVLAGDPGGSLHDRITLLTLGSRWAMTHPLFGIGPGAVRKYVEGAGVRLDQGAANHVETSFLEAWLDGGLLGGLGFLLLWLGIVSPGPSRRLQRREWIRFSCVKGLAAALTIYVLLNVTFDNLAFWLILGLVVGYQVPRPGDLSGNR